MKAVGKTQAEKDQTLLGLNGLGDRKPSELLQQGESNNYNNLLTTLPLFLTLNYYHS